MDRRERRAASRVRTSSRRTPPEGYNVRRRSRSRGRLDIAVPRRLVGNATLDASLATELSDGETPITKIEVPVAPLDQLLVEAGMDDSAIHFCSIDVEGWEQQVLEGFDVDRWRPWILVIEATEPNSPCPTHEAWEPTLLDAGYQFCLFDGLNRYYVHRDQVDRRAALLSYPACVFDEPFERWADGERRAALERANSRIPWLESNAEALQARLATIENTFSWKVTRPLRALRRLQLARPRPRGEVSDRGQAETDALKTAFALRLTAAASLLDREQEPNPSLSYEEALELSGRAEAIVRPDRAKSWLALVTADGSYPWEADVERIARSLRMDGADSVADELEWRFRQALMRRSATTAPLRVLEDAAVVDASNTVATEIRTGIQRVVRETVGRWLGGAPAHVRLLRPACRLRQASDAVRVGAALQLEEPDWSRGCARTEHGSRDRVA